MRSSEDSAGSEAWPEFLRRLALFIAPLLAVFALLEWGLAKAPNAYTEKRDLLARKGASIETLIVGSSNGFVGIAPHLLSRPALNLAYSAETLYYTNRVFAEALSRCPHVKRVVVPVGYNTLWYTSHPGQSDDWRQFVYWRVWNIPLESPRYIWDARMLSRAAVWVPLSPSHALVAAYRGLTGADGSGAYPDMDDLGWGRRPGPQGDDGSPGAAFVKLAVERDKGWMDKGALPRNLAILQQLVTTARRANVEVILVTMPVWSSYAKEIDPGIWSTTLETYRRLALEPGVRYWNLLRLPAMTEDDFFDGDHLNSRGAVRFTRILDSLLRSPDSAGNLVSDGNGGI